MSPETSLISSLFDGGRIADCRQLVPSPDYMVDQGAATIYAVMLDMAAQGLPIDCALVTDRLDMRNQNVKDAWLEAMSTRHYPGDYAAFYAGAVAEAHQTRTAKSAIHHLHASDSPTADEVAAVAEMLRAIRPEGSTTYEAKEITRRAIDHIEAKYEAQQRGETVSGIPYGIAGLDAMTNGIHPGQLVIVGARPSVGKTSLGLSVVNHAAVTLGHKTLFVSLEMTEVQDALRLVSIRSGEAYGEIDQGRLTKLGMPRVFKATGDIAEAPLMIETKPGITMPELAAQVHGMARDGLDLVVVDYLGLMRHPQFSSSDSSYKEISEISKGLKELALSTKIPIIALAQLNRGSAKNQRAPRMSDLRDSGSIEQDADVVILMHKDDDERAKWVDSELEPCLAIVDKNRNGPTGRAHLKFAKPTMAVTAWDRKWEGEWPE